MRRTGAFLLAALLLSGCGQYLFRQSDRLQIVSPRAYSSVRAPLTIRWVARDFTAPSDGEFAVFVDRDPMPPGEGLDFFARDDRDGIRLLDASSLQIPVLPRRQGVDPAEQDHHDVTVVMLDRSGRRIGEYAGFTEFNLVGGP